MFGESVKASWDVAMKDLRALDGYKLGEKDIYDEEINIKMANHYLAFFFLVSFEYKWNTSSQCPQFFVHCGCTGDRW